ncbi:MAG: ABC transporter ATP-binding protein [Leeuwenhoekiella sp.]
MSNFLIKGIKALLNKYLENFSYFYKRLGYRIILSIALSLLVGFMDGFGLAMFLPLLEMVNSNGASGESIGNLSFLIDGMNAIGLTLNLRNILLILSLFFILKGMASYTAARYEVTIKQFFIKNIRTRLMLLMSEMSYKSFVVSDSGRIQNALTVEVTRLSTAFQFYFGTVKQLVMVLVYMLFAFYIDPQFASIITIGGALTGFTYSAIYSKTKSASQELTVGSNFYQGLIIQFVGSFKYLKATGLLKTYTSKLYKIINYIEKTNKQIGNLSAIVTGTREPLLIIVVSAVILLQVNVLGGSLGTILISLLFFYRALNSFMQMQVAYNNFLGLSGSMDNVAQFEKELEKSVDEEGNLDVKDIKNGIILENVDFGYNKETPVIQNVSLDIQQNKTIAFVGESGSGKTTLVNILAGLIPLDSGEMFVNGISISNLKKTSYQKRIGYITQDAVIFNDTIFNNITFWDEKTDKNFRKFEDALAQATLLDYVNSLPKKGDSELENNGVNLSGGQKQRISIARELYKDIDLLILDEATSALDSETERSIQKNIESLHGRLTILMIAHRLSTIKNADIIVLMENGSIKAKGTYRDLLSTSSKFKRMTLLQEV